jgi:hypothetical protein
MKKKLAVLFAVSLFLSCVSACNSQHPNPKVWTKAYEQGLYNYVDSVSKPNMPDVQKRYNYLVYFVGRAKEELPNGLNSVSRDSLHNLADRIGREYAFKLNKAGIHDTGITPYYEAWSPRLEKDFRAAYLQLFETQGLKNGNVFCDFIIRKLKVIYPDSLVVPVPKQIMYNVSFGCKKDLNTK